MAAPDSDSLPMKAPEPGSKQSLRIRKTQKVSLHPQYKTLSTIIQESKITDSNIKNIVKMLLTKLNLIHTTKNLLLLDISPETIVFIFDSTDNISYIISEDQFWENIDALKDAGAEGILVVPIEKMVR